MRAGLIALFLTTTGCTAFPGCYVGVSLLPPSPIVICGADFTPPEGED